MKLVEGSGTAYDGTAVFEVPEGNYKLVETRAPAVQYGIAAGRVDFGKGIRAFRQVLERYSARSCYAAAALIQRVYVALRLPLEQAAIFIRHIKLRPFKELFGVLVVYLFNGHAAQYILVCRLNKYGAAMDKLCLFYGKFRTRKLFLLILRVVLIYLYEVAGLFVVEGIFEFAHRSLYCVDGDLPHKVAAKLVARSRTFTITEANMTAPLEIKVENLLRRTAVGFIKVDKNNKELRLAGAEFTLYRMNGEKQGEVVATGVTNNNGLVTFTELTMGSYRAKETKAPKGYKLWNAPIDFTVDEYGKVSVGSTELKPEGLVYTARITNTAEEKEIILKKVSDTGETLTGATFRLSGKRMR